MLPRIPWGRSVKTPELPVHAAMLGKYVQLAQAAHSDELPVFDGHHKRLSRSKIKLQAAAIK